MDAEVDREAGQVFGGDTSVKSNERLVSEGHEMTRVVELPLQFSSSHGSAAAEMVPCHFFSFLSILTITPYCQMGLSPLNPRESNTGSYFLSRMRGLGGNSVSP